MSEASSLGTVLQAAGISRVLWIDDRFDNVPDDTSAGVDLVELLATLHAAKQVPRHPALASLTMAMEIDEWTAIAQEAMAAPAVGAELLEGLRSQVRELSGPVSAGGAAAEYTDDELVAILDSFGANVEKVGLVAWKERRKELLSNVNRETLVIIDREFRVGGRAIKEGDEILKDVAAAVGHDVNIVMLTHSVTPQGAEALRTELASDGQVEVHRFSVMAKGGAGDAAVRLQHSVRIVMTHRTCFSLVKVISDVMSAGIRSAQSELLDQSVYDLDMVLFEKSLEEGASEADVVTRLVALRQRVEVDRHFAKDHECFRQVEALRRLRGIAELSKEISTESGALRILPEWRRAEVFDPGSMINARHAPLTCGDVFQAAGQTNCWILLAQPCDISVRKDGKRKSEQAFLVLAKPVLNDDEHKAEEAIAAARRAIGANDHQTALAQLDALKHMIEKKATGAPTQRFFRVPALIDENEWQLDFNAWTVVNLPCLDLAVFNSDGSLALKVDMQPPTALLPGWKRRLENATGELKKANGNIPKGWVLAFDSVLPKREGKLAQGELRFQYRRIGRIRSPRSIAAYAAFTSFQARAAFDHDFAEKLSKAKVLDLPKAANPVNP